ncbi:MAG: hypothetical protein ACFFEN_16610, partial [Candidatus Thorarchaeota archaeon]
MSEFGDDKGEEDEGELPSENEGSQPDEIPEEDEFTPNDEGSEDIAEEEEFNPNEDPNEVPEEEEFNPNEEEPEEIPKEEEFNPNDENPNELPDPLGPDDLNPSNTGTVTVIVSEESEHEP